VKLRRRSVGSEGRIATKLDSGPGSNAIANAHRINSQCAFATQNLAPEIPRAGFQITRMRRSLMPLGPPDRGIMRYSQGMPILVGAL